MWKSRAAPVLVVCLGGLALVLAGIGVYRLMTNAVQGRVREIGVLLALGASREVVAGATPARCAARVQPVETLRGD